MQSHVTRMMPQGFAGQAQPVHHAIMPPGATDIVGPDGCIMTNISVQRPQINPRTGLGEYSCLAAAMAIRKQLAHNPSQIGLRERQKIVQSAQHAIEIAKIRAAARPMPHIVVGGDPSVAVTPEALACDAATCPTMLAKRSRRGQTPATKCPTKVCRLHHFVAHAIWCKCPRCEPLSLMYVRQKNVVLRENWSMKGVKDMGCAAVLKRFKYEVMMGKVNDAHYLGRDVPTAQRIVGPPGMAVLPSQMRARGQYAAAAPQQYMFVTQGQHGAIQGMQHVVQPEQYMLAPTPQLGGIRGMQEAQGAQLIQASMILQQEGLQQQVLQQLLQQQAAGGAHRMVIRGPSMMMHLPSPQRLALFPPTMGVHLAGASAEVSLYLPLHFTRIMLTI